MYIININTGLEFCLGIGHIFTHSRWFHVYKVGSSGKHLFS